MGFEVPLFAAHESLAKSQQNTHSDIQCMHAKKEKKKAITVVFNTARKSTQTYKNLAQTSTS